MAKFAQCGYGSKGQGVGKTGEGYTYVVNDNVRTGDIIQVISTSRANRKFATTAVPLHTYKESTVKGQEARQKAVDATGNEPTKSYTGKELGVTGSKRVQDKNIIGGDNKQSQYTLQTRAGNIAQYMKSNPNSVFTQKSQETFEEYSKKFMKNGD